jgi:hypothetical protein
MFFKHILCSNDLNAQLKASQNSEVSVFSLISYLFRLSIFELSFRWATGRNATSTKQKISDSLFNIQGINVFVCVSRRFELKPEPQHYYIPVPKTGCICGACFFECFRFNYQAKSGYLFLQFFIYLLK